MVPSTKEEETQRLAYSPQEVADLLGKSRSWVYVRMDSGEIKSKKIGGARMIRAEHLDELVSP